MQRIRTFGIVALSAACLALTGLSGPGTAAAATGSAASTGSAEFLERLGELIATGSFGGYGCADRVPTC